MNTLRRIQMPTSFGQHYRNTIRGADLGCIHILALAPVSTTGQIEIGQLLMRIARCTPLGTTTAATVHRLISNHILGHQPARMVDRPDHDVRLGNTIDDFDMPHLASSDRHNIPANYGRAAEAHRP